MSRQLHYPDRWWFNSGLGATVLLAVLCAWSFYSWQVSKRSAGRALSAGAREELAALSVPPRKSAEVEREWVASRQQHFAHVFGPVPRAAVRRTWAVEVDARGLFTLPTGL